MTNERKEELELLCSRFRNQLIDLPDKFCFLHILSPRFTWIARPGMAPG